MIISNDVGLGEGDGIAGVLGEAGSIAGVLGEGGGMAEKQHSGRGGISVEHCTFHFTGIILPNRKASTRGRAKHDRLLVRRRTAT